MKSRYKELLALSLLAFAGGAYAQDEAAAEPAAEEEVAEENGGWFSGITGLFSGVSDWFGGVGEGIGNALSGGGGFYGNATLGVTKYEVREISTAEGFSVSGGYMVGNKLGLEAGYVDLGNSDVLGGGKASTDGYRVLAVYNSYEPGNSNAARLGLGYYALDGSLEGGGSDSTSGGLFSVSLERGLTERVYLSGGVDLYLNAEAFGIKSDIIVFGLGLSYHFGGGGGDVGEAEEAPVEVVEPVEGEAEEAPAEDLPTEE